LLEQQRYRSILLGLGGVIKDRYIMTVSLEYVTQRIL